VGLRIAFVGDPTSEHLVRWMREFESRGFTCRLFAPYAFGQEKVPYAEI
jgi:hypothetical protein